MTTLGGKMDQIFKTACQNIKLPSMLSPAVDPKKSLVLISLTVNLN